MNQARSYHRTPSAAARYATVSALGLTFDKTDAVETARLIAAPSARRRNAARTYVTPNVQHVAEMRRNPELQRAIQDADLVTCDGFPLVSYARMSGCEIPGRVTGREVVEELMLRSPLTGHVLFFLIDSVETADATRLWAESRGLSDRVVIEVAPQRFGEDQRECAALAARIRAAGTTILFIGLGAPKSELFAARYRGHLGDCWALCIGQSVRLVLGLVRRPPQICVALRMEWFWRMALEPRRLAGRYAFGAMGFGAAVLSDMFAPTGPGHRQPPSPALRQANP